MRDRLARNTVRASEKTNNLDAFADAEDAAISPEGRYVGFDIDSADYDESGDTNDDYDVYIKDLNTFFTGNPAPSAAATGRSRRRCLLDTAGTGSKLTAGVPLDVTVAGGTTGVPSNAQAVVVNITSSGETVAGRGPRWCTRSGQSKPKTCVAVAPGRSARFRTRSW